MPITRATIDEIVNTLKRHSGIDSPIQKTEDGLEGLLRFVGLLTPKGGIVDGLFNEYEKQSGSISSQIRTHAKYDDYLKSYLTQVLTVETGKNDKNDDLILSKPTEVVVRSALQQTARQINKIYAIERKKIEAAEMLFQAADYLQEVKPSVFELIHKDFIRSDRLNYRLAELLVEYPRKKGDIYVALKGRLANSFIPDKVGAEVNISCIIASLGMEFKMAASKEVANTR